MREALLHIGTHKTGSTSFQRWALGAREALADTGVHLYRPQYDGLSHYDVPLWCMRRSRMMGKKTAHPEHCLDEWRDEFEERFRSQVQDKQSVLVTAEALSLLRHEDEVRRVVSLFPDRHLRAVVVLRDPADFLASYKRQMARAGRTPSRYRTSIDYVEPDSWLVQYEDLLGVWRRVLGDDQVESVGYEEAMAAFGSTVPAVIEVLRLQQSHLPDWRGIHENGSQPLPEELARPVWARSASLPAKIGRWLAQRPARSRSSADGGYS